MRITHVHITQWKSVQDRSNNGVNIQWRSVLRVCLYIKGSQTVVSVVVAERPCRLGDGAPISETSTGRLRRSASSREEPPLL